MKTLRYLIGGIIFFAILAAVLYFTRTNAVIADNDLNSTLAAYANTFSETYPDEPINIAHECRLAQTGKYYNPDNHYYAVTCSLPSKPGVFGVVFLDRYTVYSVFSIDADSQRALAAILAQVGYE